MNFDAVQVTVNDILSVRRKYVIPRNQREFSWEKLQLDEFWDDITRNIKYNGVTGEFEFSEYFLGTIVLSGQETSGSLDIIDGQQRLSVITICLSLISRKLREIDYTNAANDILSSYIITPSNSLVKKDPTEKIEKTNGKLFFKLKFQDEIDHNPSVEYDEDKKLDYAGKYINKRISKNSCCALLNKSKVGVKYTSEEYASCLYALQQMLTNYIKMVRILVSSEDDAYDIFEVLNARGISLSSIDLIKNAIFKECTKTYPIDEAKSQWTSIDEKIKDRNEKSSLSEYIRTWWLSKINYVGEDQLYRSYKKLINDPKNEVTPQNFLSSLCEDVDIQVKIVSPLETDWKQQDQKEIFKSLHALSIFDVTIARPLILSALRLRKNKARSFSQTDLINLLKKIERFHFRFNAICGSRPSGIDSKYSSLAVSLSNASNKREVSEVLKSIHEFLDKRMPSESLFIDKFSEKLWYTNDRPNNKKLISYIFENLEISKRTTKELKHGLVSIEHIGPQKTFDKTVVGKMGNLLPLCFNINESLKSKPVSDKIDEYKKSELQNVKDFIDFYDGEWNKDFVAKRTLLLAKESFSLI